MRQNTILLVTALAACSQSPEEKVMQDAKEADAAAMLPEMGNHSQPEIATGTSVNVPSDPRASYWIISKSKMANGNLEVLTRRSGPSGESYSRREIDCDAGTVRYIGEGDTEGEAKQDSPNPGEMTVPIGESITGVITSSACS